MDWRILVDTLMVVGFEGGACYPVCSHGGSTIKCAVSRLQSPKRSLAYRYRPTESKRYDNMPASRHTQRIFDVRGISPAPCPCGRVSRAFQLDNNGPFWRVPICCRRQSNTHYVGSQKLTSFPWTSGLLMIWRGQTSPCTGRGHMPFRDSTTETEKDPIVWWEPLAWRFTVEQWLPHARGNPTLRRLPDQRRWWHSGLRTKRALGCCG